MKLHGSISINDRSYAAGDEVPWIRVYPFFFIHMLAFGGSGFIMAYAGGTPFFTQLMFGGVAILAYLLFYIVIFGLDQVEWMLINAGLGVLGIYSQIDWMLSLFGKRVADYPLYVHVIPILYFVLYTFLIRRAVLDLFGAREDSAKRTRVQYLYVGGSVGVYLVAHFLGV